MEEITKKIQSLGAKTDWMPTDNSSMDRNMNLKVEDSALPQPFLLFNKTYKSFTFENIIRVKALSNIPISDNGYVTVDGFYNLEDVKHIWDDQLPEGMLPFADGEPGDLICLDLGFIEKGAVFYWYRIAPKPRTPYLIAHSFEEFILKLEVLSEEEAGKVEGEIVKVQVSQSFLDLLKKDGYGPKD